jgi:hypothetical protein
MGSDAGRRSPEPQDAVEKADESGEPGKHKSIPA